MNTKELEVDTVNKLIQQSLPEEQKELVSDGYHNFKELYAHRVKLFVALCNALTTLNDMTWYDSNCLPWKSKLHADGTMYDGWFIAGIGKEKGKTLTYHLPIEEWDKLSAYEIENAPEWDGHTSDDVLKLLTEL